MCDSKHHDLHRMYKKCGEVLLANFSQQSQEPVSWWGTPFLTGLISIPLPHSRKDASSMLMYLMIISNISNCLDTTTQIVLIPPIQHDQHTCQWRNNCTLPVSQVLFNHPGRWNVGQIYLLCPAQMHCHFKEQRCREQFLLNSNLEFPSQFSPFCYQLTSTLSMPKCTKAAGSCMHQSLRTIATHTGHDIHGNALQPGERSANIVGYRQREDIAPI